MRSAPNKPPDDFIAYREHSSMVVVRTRKPASRPCTLRLGAALPTMTRWLRGRTETSSVSAIFPACSPVNHRPSSFRLGQSCLSGSKRSKGSSDREGTQTASCPCSTGGYSTGLFLPCDTLSLGLAAGLLLACYGLATGGAVPARCGRSARWPAVPSRCPTRDARSRRGP